ncbi:MAG: hypothetical protein H6679_00605 [Epsilonproteobacteria bacterium]|nr:hypothetical protein [Campylobacterota bacterium]
MFRDIAFVVAGYGKCVVIVLFALTINSSCLWASSSEQKNGHLMIFVDHTTEMLSGQQRQLFLDTCDSEEQSKRIRQSIETSFAFSYHHLIYALAQQTSPILVYGKHLFDNVIFAAGSAQNYVTLNKAANYYVDLLERELFPALDCASAKGEKNQEAIVKILDSIGSTAGGLQAHSKGFIFACYFLYKHLIEQWHVFEGENSYLLLPRVYAASRGAHLLHGQELLEKLGFNGRDLKETSITQLQDYHDRAGYYVSFENSFIDEVSSLLQTKGEQKWYVTLLGHGDYAEVACLSIENFCRLCSVFEEKNVVWTHVVSCNFGPKNLALVNKELKKRLGGEKGKGERMIISSGASHDKDVMVYTTNFSSELVQRYWSYFGKLPCAVYAIFPLLSSVGYGRFFVNLESMHTQYMSGRKDDNDFSYRSDKALVDKVSRAFAYVTPFNFFPEQEIHEPSAMPHIALAPSLGQDLRFYPIPLHPRALVLS